MHVTESLVVVLTRAVRQTPCRPRHLMDRRFTTFSFLYLRDLQAKQVARN